MYVIGVIRLTLNEIYDNGNIHLKQQSAFESSVGGRWWTLEVRHLVEERKENRANFREEQKAV